MELNCIIASLLLHQSFMLGNNIMSFVVNYWSREPDSFFLFVWAEEKESGNIISKEFCSYT